MPLDPTRSLAPAVATINLDAFDHNLRVLRARTPGLELIAVVKANAYGHGAVPVTRHLSSRGVGTFAVATLPEAFALREAGIDDRIIVFAAPLPGHLAHYGRHDIEATISSPDVAEEACRAARSHGGLRVHVKVDTGMGRIGMTPEQAVSVIRRLEAAPGIRIKGLWTHFASSDDPDSPAATRQWERFRAFLALLGETPAPVHVANSGGLVTNPVALDPGLVHAARIGIALYGAYDPPEALVPEQLRPAMTLTAPITQIKTVPEGTPISYGGTWLAPQQTRIGTVAIGYADGYRRHFSNRSWAGVAGAHCPVAGRVCMDMTMFDLGPEGEGPAAEAGDQAVLMGPGGPSVFDLARWADTITYEITCGIMPRVARRYVGG